MESKYVTKAKLIVLNKKAKKAGGNHIDPEFVASLPEWFKYPVCQALPFDPTPGWVRCWVTLGTEIPVIAENLHQLLLDMPSEVFDNLRRC